MIFAAFLGEGVELTGVGIIDKTEVVFAERKSRGAALKLGRQLFFPAVVAFSVLKNASKLVFSQSTDERTSPSNSLLITHFRSSEARYLSPQHIFGGKIVGYVRIFENRRKRAVDCKDDRENQPDNYISDVAYALFVLIKAEDY